LPNHLPADIGTAEGKPEELSTSTLTLLCFHIEFSHQSQGKREKKFECKFLEPECMKIKMS